MEHLNGVNGTAVMNGKKRKVEAETNGVLSNKKRDVNGLDAVVAADDPTNKSSSSSNGVLTPKLMPVEPVVSLEEADFKADWPLTGALDLAVHDLPHTTTDTEWWYVNAHLKTPEGREFSVFASFFRIVRCWNANTNSYDYSHALTWAVVDVEKNSYVFDSLLDPSSPDAIKEELERHKASVDPRIYRSMLEVVNRGNVPLPDRLMQQSANVPLDSLNLDFTENNRFTKDAAGNYICHCENKEKGVAFHLTFTPKKQPIRHGHNGVVAIGRKGDDMFYYFIPRLEVVGSVTVDNTTSPVQGQGWYDHEFGGKIRAPKVHGASKVNENTPDYGWNWLSVQLNNGVDITATTVVDGAPNKIRVLDNFSIVINPDSSRLEYTESELKPVNSWTSVRTSLAYPTKWELHVPEADIHLVAEATMPHQEFITVLTRPSFWEGRMNITGTMRGQPVTGVGFMERNGFDSTNSMDEFFSRIGKVVREEIDRFLPLNPTDEQVRDLMADEDMVHYMKGLDKEVFVNTIIKPVREIVDRGGKAWRSFVFLIALDAVGGSSYQYRHALAMPEIMHVGSLIIDDIQDKSETRRGGPTCHKIYGEAIAINAGTAAYFLGVHILGLLSKCSVPVHKKMYDLYTLTLRAGHVGQALDIHGLDYQVDPVVASGDNTRLVQSVLCTHRLKSAVPAGNLGRMGVILGGGSRKQQDAIAAYLEAIGVAFQCIDDVLNLKGLPGKTRGEDITAGKITYPVAVAMSGQRLNREQRELLWNIVKSKPEDPKVVSDAIQMIVDCGALQAAEDDCFNMVSEAWKLLDDCIPDSFYKMNLRAFGEYVVQRHY